VPDCSSGLILFCHYVTRVHNALDYRASNRESILYVKVYFLGKFQQRQPGNCGHMDQGPNNRIYLWITQQSATFRVSKMFDIESVHVKLLDLRANNVA